MAAGTATRREAVQLRSVVERALPLLRGLRDRARQLRGTEDAVLVNLVADAEEALRREPQAAPASAG